MFPTDLEPILRRVPAFAAAGALEVTQLAGGITNRNYKVIADGQAYVLRLGGEEARHLGIDRRVEYGCTLAAAGVGVAPEPVAFLEPEGYLVTRFLDGPGLPLDQVGAPAHLPRVVDALRRVHALPDFPGSFSPFRVVEAYARTARGLGVDSPARLGKYLQRAREIEAALLRRPFTPRACHNDLLNANFIDQGDRIRILDWEYGGQGDIFFDLGNLAAQHEFSPQQEDRLLRLYFGQAAPAQRARLGLMRRMSDLREAMWALVQAGASRLDFDYAGYGRKYFERFEAGVGGPEYAGWLREV